MSTGSDLLDEPVTVSDAAQEVRAARQRLDTYARGYDRIRRGSRPAAITRARVEWGLAVYEWVEVTIAQAEAEDRRSLSWRSAPAEPGATPDLPPHDQEAGQPASPGTEATAEEAKAHLDAAHAYVQACWQAYTGIRRSQSPAEEIEHVRSRWTRARGHGHWRLPLTRRKWMRTASRNASARKSRLCSLTLPPSWRAQHRRLPRPRTRAAAEHRTRLAPV
jgi:hypothetical protein